MGNTLNFDEHCFYGFVAAERRFRDVSISAKDLRRKNVSIVGLPQTTLANAMLCDPHGK